MGFSSFYCVPVYGAKIRSNPQKYKKTGEIFDVILKL
jgi:hypothetical protein